MTTHHSTSLHSDTEAHYFVQTLTSRAAHFHCNILSERSDNVSGVLHDVATTLREDPYANHVVSSAERPDPQRR